MIVTLKKKIERKRMSKPMPNRLTITKPSGSPGHEVKEYLETGLSESLAQSIASLTAISFTDSDRSLDERVADMLSATNSTDSEKVTGRRFVIWQDDRQTKAVAHARIFVREVIVDDQRIPVLALASVCSDPGQRGKGLGSTVTEAAFQYVGQMGWPDVSLFQTPVPAFYENLNCRLVTNRFVNQRNDAAPQAYPWRDETVMIYPAEFAWPACTVDLNGPDY